MSMSRDTISIGSYEESSGQIKGTVVEWGRTIPANAEEHIRWYVRYKDASYNLWHATKTFNDYLTARDYFEKLVLNGIRGVTLIHR